MNTALITSITFNVKKYKKDLFFILLISFMFFLRCRVELTQISLDGDELLAWRIVDGSLINVFKNVILDTQMPLYYLILNAFEWILGNAFNDYWIRIPSVAFSLLTIHVVFLYATRKGLPHWLAFVSVLPILYFQDSFLYLSTYARPYSLFVFLITLNFLCYLVLTSENFKKNHHQKDLILLKICFSVTLFLSALTHHLFIIYCLAIFILVVTDKKTCRFISRYFISKKMLIYNIAWLLTIYIPHFTYQYMYKRNNISWIQGKNFQELLRIMSQLTSCFGTIEFVMVLIAVISYLKINKEKAEEFNSVVVLLKYFFTTVFILYVLSNITQPLLVMRYFGIALPALFFINIFIIKSVYENNKSFSNWLVLLYFYSQVHTTVYPVVYSYIYPKVKSGIYDYKLNMKNFIKEISGDAINDGNILCLIENDYFVVGNENSSLFSMYSNMYHKKNICKKTLFLNQYNESKHGASSNILYYGNKPISEKFLQNFSIINQTRSDDVIYKEFLYFLKRTSPTL